MSSVIQATSKESGEDYMVCMPTTIISDKFKLLGLTKKLQIAMPAPDDPNECTPILLQLSGAFGHFEFSHVKLKEE